jgi:hypothetical protein
MEVGVSIAGSVALGNGTVGGGEGEIGVSVDSIATATVGNVSEGVRLPPQADKTAGMEIINSIFQPISRRCMAVFLSVAQKVPGKMSLFTLLLWPAKINT